MNRTPERVALASAFGVLAALAKYSLSPTQTQMARRAAGNCLWALGLDHYGGIDAVKPEGEIVEHVHQPALEDGRPFKPL